MSVPILKQFGDLTEADFERSAVWVCCHSADYDEVWYDDTDEDTFRPWTGPLPVDGSHDLYVVRATGILHNGSTVPALLHPSESHDIGMIQPRAFVGGRLFSFWGGIIGTPQSVRDEFFALLGLHQEDVFPIVFKAIDGLAIGVVSTTIPSWLPDANPPRQVRRRPWWRRHRR